MSAFDFAKVLKQAQALSGQLQQVQDELRRRTAEATVGGGLVRATVNGKLELVKLEIDPLAVDPRDVRMLQDLIVSAVNQATTRAQELAQQEMARAMGLPFGGPNA
jgi:nucleoid-associated protein EbfC